MQPKKKHLLKSYFTFTANERRAVLILVALSVAFFILPHIYPAIYKPKQEVAKELIKVSESHDKFVVKANIKEDQIMYDDKQDPLTLHLFYFDPNKATIQDWKLLGVKEKTAQTIIRYRSKGGIFRTPGDLKKIWGLSAQMANRLMPFVRINSDTKESVLKIVNEKTQYVKPTSELKIDINAATQEEWEKLKGIGPATAARIIKFRDKVGGFFSVDQIGETYGLQDSVFQQIRAHLIITNDNIQKININHATIEELGRHPYIRFKTAKVIIAYREQNGYYKVVSDLQRIESISPDVYQKMEKYLTVDK